MDIFLAFLTELLNLVPVIGFGAGLIAFVIDTLKRFGLVPDTYAPLASGLLNLVLFAVVYFLGDSYGAEIESVVAALTELAPFVVGLLVALLSTEKAHRLLEGVGIGYSH